jgi:hypothetical protein
VISGVFHGIRMVLGDHLLNVADDAVEACAW